MPLLIPQFGCAPIARHDSREARGTGCPTASPFHAGFGECALPAAIHESNQAPAPPAFPPYVRLPLCRDLRFHRGCNRIIAGGPGRADRYLRYLQCEMERTVPLFDTGRDVRQWHHDRGAPHRLRRCLTVGVS